MKFPHSARAFAVAVVLLLAALTSTDSDAKATFNTVAVDDDYIFEKNPLYVNRNDQNPYSVMDIVMPPLYGQLINNGMTASYGIANGIGSYVDVFSYRWCIPQPRRTGTVQ